MRDLYRELEWLERTPADFRRRIRSLGDSDLSVIQDLQKLASYALDENGLGRLADLLERIEAEGGSVEPLTKFRLGIVGSGTLKHLPAALIGTAIRHGIALECVLADYGQTVQEAINPESQLNSAKVDAVLIAIDHRGLPSRAQQEVVADSLAFFERLRSGFHAHANIPCIIQTVAKPPESIFGSFDGVVSQTLYSQISEINRELLASIDGTHDLVFDVARLCETVGSANWFSPTHWNLGKFSFDAAYLPLYCDHLLRLIASSLGKSKKCLVLDLDNTLWGGVIGDDGLNGIVLGQGNATGEAHLELQRTALALRDRGIILAVSSKNDDANARLPFREHAEMILRESHIAVFQANWSDKATNLVAIARELEIGIDSLVFVDDNPAERALVRASLPSVAVPEMPGDPALFARTLLAAGYFEAIAFSDEDRARAKHYQNNASRAALREQIADIEAYLASLRMTIHFRPFDDAGRPRIAQLINKSNQFNLTTKRYSEADVAAMATDSSCFTLQVRLSDVFDDNGMISVVICRLIRAAEWSIDTWLMSCRVLGRRVEQMVLREILLSARARGISRVIGTFIPSAKNGMVKDHYEKLGFTLVSIADDGQSVWVISSDVEIPEAPMTVDRGEMFSPQAS